MKPEVRARLVELYKEIAALTKPKCGQCRRPYSCCAPEHCISAFNFARAYWDVMLEPTNHPKIPFMGPNGCVVEPHLRPACSVHTCNINSIGFEPKDLEMTKRYFEIRGEIEELELENFTF